MAVAVDHRHGFKPPAWRRHCRLRSFPHADAVFFDPDPCPSALPRKCSPSPSFHRSLSTPCFSSSSGSGGSGDDPLNDSFARVEIVGGRRSLGIHTLVIEAAIAMASGAQPIPVVSDGLGKTFCLRNRSGESFAVVKPVDEEPTPPLGMLGRHACSRHSARASETGPREVAAYLLDHDGFSGVPPTALIKISHPVFRTAAAQTASIQRFVSHDFDAGELGSSRFSISSVHRIGILDVRLLNIDRHAGNILVKKQLPRKGSYDSYCGESAMELVPIDHGLCLPDILDDPYFEWLHWPQSAVPFSESEVEFIAALDPLQDADILRRELPSLRESAIRILVLCTTFLKQAVVAGLCLADIGDMMTREFSTLEEGPSVLEILCQQAEESMNRSATLASSDEDDTVDEDSSRDAAKEIQFEMECDDDDDDFTENCIGEVLDIPLLLQHKACEHRLDSLREDDKEEEYDDGDSDDDDREGTKIGGIMKSVSFSAANFNYDSAGSGCKSISFKDFTDEEWAVFLTKFEQLLPEAFEVRKSTGLRQRLGTSCKF